MASEQAIRAWKQEERQPFAGWDFSYLEGRMVEEQPPWCYARRAGQLLSVSSCAIDLDTGGGERLAALRPFWSGRVIATENHPPNLKLANERLAPHGATVLDIRLTDTAAMPFREGSFDLVLNRHAAFCCEEVARVLAPGGTFLTQQVHGMWAHDLLAAFGTTPQWPDATPAKYLPRLRAAGLGIVDAREWTGSLRFADVGAIVYYLRAVPWLVPGFSVATHSPQLLALQRRLEDGQELSFLAAKYLIEARKPPSAWPNAASSGEAVDQVDTVDRPSPS